MASVLLHQPPLNIDLSSPLFLIPPHLRAAPRLGTRVIVVTSCGSQHSREYGTGQQHNMVAFCYAQIFSGQNAVCPKSYQLTNNNHQMEQVTLV